MQLKGTTQTLDAHSSLLYCEHYLTRDQADALLDMCSAHVHWVQSRIMMFGKRVAIPRLNAWFGEHSYRYSGTTFPAQEIPSKLQTLQQRINTDTGWQLNSVLANLYRDGGDGMGWHSDDEKSLGECPQIASVSLGASRKFVLRQRKDKTTKHSLELRHGSLLLMLGKCQADWQHALPKTKRSMDQRVNLTFRESHEV